MQRDIFLQYFLEKFNYFTVFYVNLYFEKSHSPTQSQYFFRFLSLCKASHPPL